MNISITKTLLVILGGILLIAGVIFGIEAMRATNWQQGIFALVGIAVGFALIVGKGVTVSQ